MALRDWAREQQRVYFGNASSVRDYRAQLRGVKAALFWAVYLGLLILFVTIAYANIVSKGEQSVTQAQNDLKGFYMAVMVMLEVMVGLVAPVIVALSIQGEIQRKSFDLVMTSPVSPKYFLVGKVVSGYRYVVMLLFLSLPVAAAAVVLGGTTWSEVLITYVLIAARGLIYIGISLPIAVMSQKIAPAVVYSYMACWSWSLGLAVPLAGMMMIGMGGPPTQEMPFVYLLYPMSTYVGVTTYTTLLGFHFPNWILAVLTQLAVVKLMVVGAGSAMSRAGSKETVSLRIHGLVVAALLTFCIGWGGFGRAAAGSRDPAQELAIFITTMTVPFVFVIAHLSTWSYLDERKNRPGGLFDVRRMLSSAPEGGLPYLFALIATVALSGTAAWSLDGGTVPPELIAYMFWLAGAWFFFWAMGWLLSSYTATGIGTARKSHIAFTILVSLLPWPILGIFQSVFGMDVFDVYPFGALRYDSSQLSSLFLMAMEFWVVGAVLVVWGEGRRKSVVSSKRGLVNG